MKLRPSVLAKRAHLSSETVTDIEDKGQVTRLNVIEDLAKALRVTPGWLAYAKPREAPVPPAEPPAEPLHRSVRERLRERRADLSVRALARAAGCSDTAIRTIESGTVTAPGVDTIERLADALGIPPAWLAFGEGEDPAKGPTE